MEYSKVGKYYEVFSGYAFKSQDLKETADIPIIKIGNISNGRNVINENMQFVSKELLGINKKYYVNRGDVLLSLTGSHMNQPNSVVGRSCRNYSDRLYLLNQRAGKIVPKNNASLSYIYYVLQTQAMKEMICCRAYGAANQVNVSPKSIMSIKWNFPSSDVQHSIASILSTYDTLIENNTKRIRLLEKMAENLYKEWFVRFRFPGHENVEMENGLPKGWKRGSLSDVCEFKRGKNITSSEMQEGNVPVIAAGLEPSGYHFCSNVRGVNVTMSSSGANAGYIAIHYSDIWAADCSYIEESTTGNIYYVYELLNNIRTVINNFQRGAAQPHVYPKDVNRIKLILPSKELMLKANGRLEIMHKEIYNLQKQNSLLARQRDLLLPRLMSGKLEVKEELLE
mgnify:FL=1